MGCFWRMLLLRTLAITIQVLLQNTVNSNDDENVINEIIQYCIEVFLGKVVLKIYSKFTGEHPS